MTSARVRTACLAACIGTLMAAPSRRARAEMTDSVAAALVRPFARPIGGSFGGVHTSQQTGGPFLGLEASWAVTLPVTEDPAQGSAAFGVRGGWAFPNGLSAQLRYDDLGVRPDSSRAPLQWATAGLRYSLPFVVPLPFAEIDAGTAFVTGDVHPGAGAALGISIPIGPVLVDVVGHDWFVPIAATLRQTVTVGLGLSIVWAMPGRL